MVNQLDSFLQVRLWSLQDIGLGVALRDASSSRRVPTPRGYVLKGFRGRGVVAKLVMTFDERKSETSSMKPGNHARGLGQGEAESQPMEPTPEGPLRWDNLYVALDLFGPSGTNPLLKSLDPGQGRTDVAPRSRA